MISDYIGDIIIDKTFDFGRNTYNRYIYKNPSGSYIIRKTIKGKQDNYGSYPSLPEARKVRDLLIDNNWDKGIIQDQLDEQEKIKTYYKHVRRNNRYYLVVNYEGDYCGQVKTIEEALYYRDLVSHLPTNEVKKPREFDLTKDNPYLDGLEVPLPERLIIDHKDSDYGKGHIQKKGEQSYHVYYSDDYFYACPTFEMAYYMKKELNKVGWDKSKVQQIAEDYPVWYTWLMNFYRYIIPKDNGYAVNFTPKNNPEGKLEHLYFRRLEDALWERDLLMKYNWDEELLVECADDNENPYYDMELPPYPQRKIRRIQDREPRTELFNMLFEAITENPNLSQEEYAKLAGTNAVTVRNVLRKEFDTSWPDFIKLCESGEHPNDVLEQKPIIYNPDLTRHYDNNGHIAYYKGLASKYVVSKWHNGGNIYYGAYPTRELAEKIVKDLVKCDWDKSQLKRIQDKHGHVPMMNSKRWVYANKYKTKKGKKVSSYSVRRKNKDREMVYYGTYKDKRVAEMVRDLLIKCDWNKDFLQDIQDYAFYCISEVDRYENYKSY